MERRNPSGGPPYPPGRRRGRPYGPERSGEERLSRFLSYVLRHHPEEAGLELDERGAADLDALVEAIRGQRGFAEVTREQIEALVASEPANRRFEIRENRIRARYGHSLAQPIQYEPAEPPEFLFHGTTPEEAEKILGEGLKPGERQRVHLSIDMPAAREVGRRRCETPVILQIDTASARKGDVAFYRGGSAVWLSDAIPPECITRAEPA